LRELPAGIVTLRESDRALREMLVRYGLQGGRLWEIRARIETLSEELPARARRLGAIRSDFAYADLAVLLWSLGPILDATAGIAPDAWRRHVTFWLDGLTPPAPTPSPIPPLSPRELERATARLRLRRRQLRDADAG